MSSAFAARARSLRLPRLGRRSAIGLSLSLAMLAGGFALAWKLDQRESRPLTLDGVPLPASDPEPAARALAAQWHATELTLDAGSQIVRASRREAGGRIDVERAVAEARLARGLGPLPSRVVALLTDAPRDLEWSIVASREDTRSFVEELRRRTTVDPEPRRRDGSGGRPGTSMDLVGAVDAVRGAIGDGRLYVRLPVRALEAPTERARDLRTARFTEVVAAHETRYAHLGGEGRARNIELSARFLDGATIAPGEQLSFNQVVGERTFERGFAPAIELARGGRRTEGIGGGVCQVAATLHAAAFFAGFELLEHHPHTRNSTYIPAGLDTAVSWPNKDLVIENPHPFHVRVHATAYRGLLRIELMGPERAPRVEWNTRVLQRFRRPTEREVDLNLPLGTEEVVDEGEDGSLLERTRTVYWADGAVTQTDRLRYPVVSRLVTVGPSEVRAVRGAPGGEAGDGAASDGAASDGAAAREGAP